MLYTTGERALYWVERYRREVRYQLLSGRDEGHLFLTDYGEPWINHPMLALPDDREDYGEERWVAFGWIQALLGVVVYTERGRRDPYYLSPKSHQKRGAPL